MLIDPYRFAHDEFFDDTFMLIHVENGQIYERTGFPAVTVSGDGVVSSAQAKFGTQSFSNPGNGSNGDYVRVGGNATDFVFPGELTIEGWFYIRAFHNTFNNFFANNINFPGAGFIQIAVTSGTKVVFLNSTAGVISSSPTGAYTGKDNKWTHVALTRNAANTGRIWIDGIQVAQTLNLNGVIGGANAGVSSLDVGRSHAGDNTDLDAFFEEIRVTKRCRYTENFTPPTAPFPPFP